MPSQTAISEQSREQALVVTQADRDAAAEFLRGDGHAFDQLWAGCVEAGRRDDHVIVQLLARHRIAALSHTAPTEEDVERAGDAIQAAWNCGCDVAAGLPPIEFTQSEKALLAKAALSTLRKAEPQSDAVDKAVLAEREACASIARPGALMCECCRDTAMAISTAIMARPSAETADAQPLGAPHD